MDKVISVVNRSNQRGGRMLSVVDLIKAETLSISQAAWLLDRIAQGSSWLVGARPGGAGKTTVMSALLAMIPASSAVRLTNSGTGWEKSRAGEYVVSYELSPGSYDAYIWGSDIRRFVRLGAQGCRIVSNLHADTLSEASEQLAENGVEEDAFSAFSTFIPLSLNGGTYAWSRRVECVFYVSHGSWRSLERDCPLSARHDAIRSFLDQCLAKDMFTVENVRVAWLDWCERGT